MEIKQPYLKTEIGPGAFNSNSSLHRHSLRMTLLPHRLKYHKEILNTSVHEP